MNEQALKASSFQRIDHLLLSDDAKAFSKPSLDIDIDDVSSEHGATVGWMDEQQLMYMQARGIALEDAKKAYMNAKVDSIYQSQTSSHVGLLKTCLGYEHE